MKAMSKRFAGSMIAIAAAALAVILLLAAAERGPSQGEAPKTTSRVSAPTPHTADGKVDFSGIWQLAFGGGGGRGRGAGAAPPQPPPPVDPNAIPNSTFGEVAGRGYPLPLQPWAAALKKERMADNMKDNPDVWCLPIGIMQYHNHPQPRQIVQTKNLTLITYESNYGLRYIYTDGRPASEVPKGPTDRTRSSAALSSSESSRSGG